MINKSERGERQQATGNRQASQEGRKGEGTKGRKERKEDGNRQQATGRQAKSSAQMTQIKKDFRR